MKMTTDLRRRLTDAIRNAPGMGLTVTSVVDAVMAVRDEEIAALRAEMERLKRDLTLATTRGDNWEAAYHHERKRADYAEAEVTRLRAGESPHPAPEHVNTTPAQRLELAQWVKAVAARSGRCIAEDHDGRLARAQQAELALARVRDDCQEQTHRPITDLLDQGIRSQALRTLNIIKRALNEDTTDQAPDTPPPVAVPADAGLLEHQQGD